MHILRLRSLAVFSVVGSSFLLLGQEEPAAARPNTGGGCGAQFYGNPYLVCHPPGEGSEAVPTICQRAYRRCGGVVTFTGLTRCENVERGSTVHQILATICAAVSPKGEPPPPDTELPIPDSVDAVGFMKSTEVDPVVAYPDVTAFDFPNDGIDGPVPAHRHPNGRGIVADSVHFDDPASAVVDPNAMVYGDVSIAKNATILGYAQVYGKAVVGAGAFVANDARVSDSAHLDTYAGVLDTAHVGGNAYLAPGAVVSGKADLGGSCVVPEDAHITSSSECSK